MKKVGIITYHSAYNYGSVLQAKATEYIVKKLGFDAKVLNYRMPSQRAFYSLYRYKYGMRTFVKDILMLPHHNCRKERARKFEEFIKTFSLTDEFENPKDAEQYSDAFDCFISGSDQIWNKNSCELFNVDWSYMDPFLLRFTNKRRISYASSIATTKLDEFERILPYISEFDYLACREKLSAEMLSNMLKREVKNVLDPTLLLDSEEWSMLIEYKSIFVSGRYILLYSLGGYKDIRKYIDKAKELAKSKNLMVICITPFLAFRNDKVLKFVYNVGPADFLSLIWNAEMIITDSYHGSLFCVNFHKPFYSISNGQGSHMRKNQILELLHLENRIIDSPEKINTVSVVDYRDADRILCIQREQSLEYLRDALK